MTKEQEIMEFLQEKVFNPILENKNLPMPAKMALNMTISKMKNLSADEMISYFQQAVSTSKSLFANAEGANFEAIIEEFKNRFIK